MFSRWASPRAVCAWVKVDERKSGRSLDKAGGLALLLGLAAYGAAGTSSAQELVYTPINPSFGGNPFNADYLLGVATAQRPERERTEEEERELSETEQFARQLQSRLLSALSSSLVEAITGAPPGTTGEFVVGDQTIFFERSLSSIRLVITNNLTGEVTEIIVPVFNFNRPAGAPSQFGDGAASPMPGSSLAAAAPGKLGIAGATALEPQGPLDKPLLPKDVTSGDLVF